MSALFFVSFPMPILVSLSQPNRPKEACNTQNKPKNSNNDSNNNNDNNSKNNNNDNHMDNETQQQ